ncbi:biotin/lipoyl-containing protein [Marinobacter sp. HL-58]|uniref:biotin/lipoyl-containing protein n=1 Tax=Marinobacter sp. HL-58 TaxID=1479237 RepID=UPI000486A687|nr:biotin/lipoyl-containing protein [Marinobacter sp. HL-58]KPP99364.1 MAG: pyruvate dehydrogenase E2 component (dihydrolipoamide acetyltransferase) [Marinobacter sp. HL-58]
MPLDVIMPALGMAQDSGVILAWHKSPGDPVAEGDALFEVETDKAAMEVEAQGSGFLTDVMAKAGDEVPVGQVLARISDTPEDTGTKTEASPDASGEADTQADQAMPEGEPVIMPALGMAQDAGQIVAWRKSPGDAVTASDVLFEVETDKSIMEVEAGHDGFVAALLAEAGEEAPVGDVIAIISSEKPEAPIQRSLKDRGTATPAEAAPAREPAPAKESPSKTSESRPTKQAVPAMGGRILASPKARRLALERGLDLTRLADHGYPQPYHVKDLEVLERLPTEAAPQLSTAAPARYLSAHVETNGFDDFAAWAASEAGLPDAGSLLAAFAGSSLERAHVTVALEAFGKTRMFAVHGRWLSDVAEADPEARPDLRLRDLRFGRLIEVQAGPEDTPVLSVMASGAGLKLTLECAAEQLDASAAITLLSNFAGRMEQPLRHLL